MDESEKRDLRKDFDAAVNMSPGELEKWLSTEESLAVGQKDGAAESVGHHSGRRIVEIKRTKAAISPTPSTSTCARWSAMSPGTDGSGPMATSPTRAGGTR